MDEVSDGAWHVKVIHLCDIDEVQAPPKDPRGHHAHVLPLQEPLQDSRASLLGHVSMQGNSCHPFTRLFTTHKKYKNQLEVALQEAVTFRHLLTLTLLMASASNTVPILEFTKMTTGGLGGVGDVRRGWLEG